MIGVVITIVMALDRLNEIPYPLGSYPRYPYNFHRGFSGVGTYIASMHTM
jgi:hypothetical protein